MHVYGTTQVHGPQALGAPHARLNTPSSLPASSFSGDELQISSLGQMLGRLAEVPDIRANRVAELRAAILDGRYDSEEKLSVALDRLLDEIG